MQKMPLTRPSTMKAPTQPNPTVTTEHYFEDFVNFCMSSVGSLPALLGCNLLEGAHAARSVTPASMLAILPLVTSLLVRGCAVVHVRRFEHAVIRLFSLNGGWGPSLDQDPFYSRKLCVHLKAHMEVMRWLVEEDSPPFTKKPASSAASVATLIGLPSKML